MRPLSVKITLYDRAHSFLRIFLRIFFSFPRLLEILFGVIHGSERTCRVVNVPRAQQHTPRARAPFAFVCEIQGHERHEHWPHRVEAKRPGRQDPRDLSPSSRAATGGRKHAEIVLAALRASPRCSRLSENTHKNRRTERYLAHNHFPNENTKENTRQRENIVISVSCHLAATWT